MKRHIKLALLTIVIATSVFSASIEEFVATIFEQYPDAVAIELTWQSAYDNYNATLLNADSKLNIMQADLERLKAYKEYIAQRWRVIEEVFGILFELEEISIQRSIAEIEYKMYSEDLSNKEKAMVYGGVSQMEVDVAKINADKSKGKLDYYKSVKSQKEKFIKDTLFISELPSISMQTEGLKTPTVEEMNSIKKENIDRQIESYKKQIEDTKYKLAQSGMTTSFLADVNKRSAKIHELKEQAFANASIYYMNIACEDVNYSALKYKSAIELKALHMQRLSKLQEAQKEGYITSYDYYQGVLDVYDYDITAWEEKYNLFKNVVKYLKAKGTDPLEYLSDFVKAKE